MGGLISGPKTLWTPEEQAEIEQVTAMYEFAVDYIKKSIYKDIPFRSGKKSTDPTSTLWAEPITDTNERNIGSEQDTIAKDILDTTPSGVMVDRKGKFQILFSLVDLCYSFDISDLKRYLNDMKSLDGLPEPQPPMLGDATKTSLELQWLSRLPYPPGIVQAVEVQYATASSPSIGAQDTSESKVSDSAATDSSSKSPLRWFSLVTRTYHKSQIGSYTWAHIAPGSGYHVRMRYRTTGSNWSPYSEPSPVYKTLPDRPRAPPAPTCLPVTSFAIQIIWGATSTNPGASPAPDTSNKRGGGENGSPITEYLLIGKSTGDEFTEIYRGENKSFLLLGLYPEFAFSFQVAAINAVGMSDYSPVVTVQTPARPVRSSSIARSVAVATAAGVNIDQLYDFSRALYRTAAEADKEVVAVSGFTEAQIAVARMCRDAWREYWDGNTEQMFYFNSILSIRQLEVPPILRSPGGAGGVGASTPGAGASARHTTAMSRSSSTDATAADRAGTAGASRRRSNPSNSPLPESPPPRAPVGSVDGIIDPNSPEMQFRKKRFRLLLALRKQKANFAKSRDVVHLELSRATMLADCYTRLSALTAADFRRRLRVSFIGERGLDCGGLSKEAYLLLSKQAAYYAGPKYHKWLRSLVSTVPKQLTRSEPSQPAMTAAAKEKASDVPVPSDGTAVSAATSPAAAKEVRDEQVEGYFFAPINETVAAPKLPSTAALSTRSGSQTGTASGTVDPQAEECYASILELDTQQRISSAEYFKFLGRLLGKALFDRQLVDFPLSPLLCKHLLGEFAESVAGPRTQLDLINASIAESEKASSGGGTSPPPKSTKVTAPTPAPAAASPADTARLLEELKFLDKEAYTSLKWMVDNNITDIIYETFSVSDGQMEFPLCADGAKMNVTEANKLEYVRLMIQWKTSYSVAHNLTPFVSAFHEIVPLDLLRKSELTPIELNAMLNGKSEVNVEELRAFCIYQSEDTSVFNDTHDTVIWFWQAVRAFSQAERRNLLLFFTGSARVPLDGYDPPLSITEGDADMSINSLPCAHTCFNQIVLPRYANAEMCAKQLKFAMENTVGFELM